MGSKGGFRVTDKVLWDFEEVLGILEVCLHLSILSNSQSLMSLWTFKLN